MNIGNVDFERALKALATEHHSASAPPAVELAVLAEFDAARRLGRVRRIAAYGALAAMVAIGAFGIRKQTVHEAAAPALRPPVSAPAIPPVERTTSVRPLPAKLPRRRQLSSRAPESPAPVLDDAFYSIPYTVPLEPGERTAIVRMTLSDAAFAAIGFPGALPEPAGSRQADVLVGEDGRARAIRLVADASFQ